MDKKIRIVINVNNGSFEIMNVIKRKKPLKKMKRFCFNGIQLPIHLK